MQISLIQSEHAGPIRIRTNVVVFSAVL